MEINEKSKIPEILKKYQQELLEDWIREQLSAPTLRTKEGFVFNVDARLRPSGSAGPLVVSEEALLKYHSGATQVWERQALTKARAAAGEQRLNVRRVFKPASGASQLFYHSTTGFFIKPGRFIMP